MSDLGEALVSFRGGGGGGGGCATGMFHSGGYGFQAVYSGIGYKECDEQWTFNQRELDYVIKLSFVLI